MRRRKNIFRRGLLLLLLAAGNPGCMPAYKANIDEALAGQLVWPAPPEKPRIEYLWSLYSFLPEGENFSDYMLEPFDEINGLSLVPYMLRPSGLCLDDHDRLYIVDQGVPRVTAVDLKTRAVKHFGFEGAGQLFMPIAVAADLSGNIFVTDSGAGKVNIYNSDGGFTGALGGEGFFKRPTGIAFEKKSGRLFIIDTGTHVVHAFDSAGKRLFGFGKRGEGDGEFNYPTHIAAGQDGKIYVTDALNFRVQVFDSAGKFLGKFGRQGDTYADLEKPKGVSSDTFGNVYIVDALQDMIKIFNSEGKLLLFFGENGRAPGNFSMPLGIFVDAHNRIFVADTYNMRVQAFRLLEGKGL